MATRLLNDEADWVREEAAFSVVQVAPLLGDSFRAFATTRKEAVRRGIYAGLLAIPFLGFSGLLLDFWLYLSAGGALFGPPADTDVSQPWLDTSFLVLSVVLLGLDISIGYGVYRWQLRRAVASGLLPPTTY